MKYLLITLCTICCLRAGAQTYTGKLVDKNTKKPLQSVFVTAYSGSAFTKDDGTFSINISKFNDTIRIKTLGYKPYALAVSAWGAVPRLIQLEPQSIDLKEVTINAKKGFL